MRNLLLTIILLISFASKGYSLGPIYSDTLICTGTVYPFANDTSGGTWESSDTLIAKIDTTTGDLTAISVGVVTITYHVGSAFVTRKLNVRPGVTPIIGNTEMCAGTTMALTDTTTGGTWSSWDTHMATVDTDGLVTGVSTPYYYHPTAIAYILPNGCYDTIAINVHELGGRQIFRPYNNLCVQGGAHYMNVDTGGTWSMYDTTFATVDPVSGWAYGKAVGDDTVFYTVTNVCGTGTLKIPIRIYELNSSACWVSEPTVSPKAGSMNTYPNPVQNVLTITIEEQYPLNAVTVMNLAGSSVITKTEQTNETHLDLSALSPGVYFIHVNGRDVRKIVKQ